MDLNGEVSDLPHGLDQLEGPVRGQQARHILNADGVRTQLFHFFGELGEIVQGEDRARRIADSCLGMAPVFLGRLHGGLQISRIIQRIEDPDDVDPVFNRLGHEELDEIVRIVLITQDILPTEEHLGLGILQALAEGPKPLPRILIQIPHAGVEGRSAPALHGIVSRRVNQVQRPFHLIGRHPGGNQALRRIPEDGIHHFN